MYEIELDPEIVESVRMASKRLSEMKFSKQLEEASQRMAEYTQAVAVQIQPAVEQLNYTRQTIQDTIPNIRCIQENSSFETPEFSEKFNSIMQTLDFPVVQPKITRKQLEQQLKSMNRPQLLELKKALEKALNEAPANPAKNKFRKIKLTSKNVYHVIEVLHTIYSVVIDVLNFFKG